MKSAGNIPQIRAVCHSITTGCILALIGMTDDKKCRFQLFSEGNQGCQTVAHFISTAHVDLGRKKSLYRVKNAQCWA